MGRLIRLKREKGPRVAGIFIDSFAFNDRALCPRAASWRAVVEFSSWRRVPLIEDLALIDRTILGVFSERVSLRCCIESYEATPLYSSKFLDTRKLIEIEYSA